jgi:hypothetical protein
MCKFLAIVLLVLEDVDSPNLDERKDDRIMG